MGKTQTQNNYNAESRGDHCTNYMAETRARSSSRLTSSGSMAEEAMTNVNIRQIIREEIRQAFADEFGAQIKLIKDELGGRLLRIEEKL